MKTILSARNVRWIAWSLVGLYAILEGSGLALQVVTKSSTFGVALPIQFLEAVVLSIWAVVGALIISRNPQHPIGWIWCILPIMAALDIFSWGYAYYGFITYPGSVPGVEFAIVWLYLLSRGTLDIFMITLLLLLFPTGRPLSLRWGIVAWIAAGATSIAILVNILEPIPVAYFPFPTDLLAVGDPVGAVLDPLRWIGAGALVLCLVAATFSLLIRLKQARGVERQQLKWFVYMSVFVPPGFFLSILGQSSQNTGPTGVFLFGISLMLMSFAGIAIASAIAILRYRLWDIDVIIRRTLQYTLLIGILALIYFGGVVLIQSIFSGLTGSADSPFITVLSTLAIAALFNPLRGRIQDFIDRRFYRAKYDAERTLARFAATARDEVDLEQLSDALLAVVEETMQPEQAKLWLKTSESESSERLNVKTLERFNVLTSPNWTHIP
ncbi:MAG: hypothetical protein PVG14_01870 [Anaerolineales bacterium]